MRALIVVLRERGPRFVRGLGPITRFLVALNILCWLLFLSRAPEDPRHFAREDATPPGTFSINSAAGSVVAGRSVAPGGWHGNDTRPVEAYRWLHWPAIFVASLLYLGIFLAEAFVGLGLSIVLMLLDFDPGGFLWIPSLMRSWLLAACLFVSTTVQWLLIGRLVDLFLTRLKAIPRLDPRVMSLAFLISGSALTAWWWPEEHDRLMWWASFDGQPEPILAAIESRPSEARLWRYLGGAYRMKDRWAEALPAYRRSLELDPTDFDAWADFGLASSCLGDKEGAARAAERLLALDREWAVRRLENPPECCGFEVCPK